MTFGELKQFVQDYLEVDETTFTTNLPQFVRATEEVICRSVQLPEFRKTDASLTFTTGVNTLSLPSDFLSSFSFTVVDGTTHYSLLNKEVGFMREVFPTTTTTGRPRFYAMYDDATFIVGPTPDDTYATELHYYYLPTSLADGADGGETWLSTHAENAMMFGTIYHGYVFLKGDQDVVQSYREQFELALGNLKTIGEGRNRKDTYRTPDTRMPV